MHTVLGKAMMTNGERRCLASWVPQHGEALHV